MTAAWDRERALRAIRDLEHANEYEPLGHDGWTAAALLRAADAEIARLRSREDGKNRGEAAPTCGAGGGVEGMSEWQPIETAPKDGTMVLLYRPAAFAWGQVTPGKWDDQRFHKKPRPYWEMWLKIGGVYESRAWEPTHWMPLPAAPDAQEPGE